jgi:hypothetical protein
MIFEAELDDSGTVAQQAAFVSDWIDAHSGTQKGRGRLLASDTTGRECFRWESSGTAGKVSFFGLAAQPRPATLTQTYSTFNRTLPAYTTDPENVAYTGIATGVAGTPYAQLTDMNSLRVAYENLRCIMMR